ncbi:MAG: NAD(P)/FAD-dependent oxidoreductase, partial [Microbacterium sp.]
MSKAQKVHTTVVIGAGFVGLGTAIKLREAGIEDLVILERADRVGGTWRDATYPGAACDIPSQLYSFSFAKNPGWSRAYSPSAEILEHIEELVERFDLVKDIRFNTE